MLDKAPEDKGKKYESFVIKKEKGKLSSVLGWLSAILTGIATIFAGFMVSENLFTINSKPKTVDIICDTTLVFKRITELENSVNQLNAKLDSSIIVNKDSLKQINPNNIQLAQTKSEIEQLNIKVKDLEKVILDNPEKAISILLVKQQISNDKEQNEREQKTTKDEIARVYDMNKWIIGLVFTMLVSIVVLNISNLFAKAKKE